MGLRWTRRRRPFFAFVFDIRIDRWARFLRPFVSPLSFLSKDLVDLSFYVGAIWRNGVWYFWMGGFGSWCVRVPGREKGEWACIIYHLSIYPAAIRGLKGLIALNINPEAERPGFEIHKEWLELLVAAVGGCPGCEWEKESRT